MAVVAVTVDRNDPTPLYFQVARQLEHAIVSGELAVGERLENELALAECYGLSRPTMRSAIAHLVDKGLLVRQRGVGTQVVRRTVERPVKLTSLYEDLVTADQEPTTQVLLREQIPADTDIASQLGVEAGTPVIHLERLRCVHDQPLAVLRNWLPADIAGDFSDDDLNDAGLYELLRRTGIVMHDASQRIGAQAAEAPEAKLLGLRKGAPLLTMERLSYDAAGRAVELGRHAYDASQYAFTVSLSE